ncbi:MAG: hypothetical protein HY547_09045 [Elusimicrobia bacterium]|nr:hypothetical protein [Elusimicrobiota bacterium]
MQDIKSSHEKLQTRRLWNEESADQLKLELGKIRSYLIELGGGYSDFYGGDASHWKNYCERGAAVIDGSLSEALLGNWQEARLKFLEINSIENDAHGQFRPGFFKRVSAFFSKKSKKEVSNHEK